MKAQSAIEYLATYGWMFIALATVTGVIGFLYQDTCVKSSSGLEGAAVAVDQFGLSSNGELSVSILNSKSHEITVERLEASTVEGTRPVTLNQDLEPGRTNQVNFQGFRQSGECSSFDVRIEYSERSLDNQYISGSLRMNAELDNSPFAIAEANNTRSSITADKGQNITFDASESGDPRGQSLTYDWDLNDSNTETGENFNYSYDTAGTYLVELNVTNQDGLSGQDYIQVNVLGSLNAVAKAHNETGIYEKGYLEAYETENITFDASDTPGSGLTYEWKNSTDTLGTGEILEDREFGFGLHEINLTVENTEGNTAKDSITLNVTTPLPSAPSDPEFWFR